MRNHPGLFFSLSLLAKIIVVCVFITLLYHFGFLDGLSNATTKTETETHEASGVVKDNSPRSEASVDLSPNQLNAIKVEPVVTHSFRIEKEAVGSVVYHEKDARQAAHSGNASRFVVANVSESDGTLIHIGQSVAARVVAYPDRVFSGKVSAVGVTVYDSGGNPALDPVTHRITARCEIADPRNELYPGMLATIVIQVQEPVESAAIPVNGVVRKGDGTMTAWVTKDRKHFNERTVKVGLQEDGYDQILDGLEADELVATDGAIFVSNILYAPPGD